MRVGSITSVPTITATGGAQRHPTTIKKSSGLFVRIMISNKGNKVFRLYCTFETISTDVSL